MKTLRTLGPGALVMLRQLSLRRRRRVVYFERLATLELVMSLTRKNIFRTNASPRRRSSRRDSVGFVVQFEPIPNR